MFTCTVFQCFGPEGCKLAGNVVNPPNSHYQTRSIPNLGSRSRRSRIWGGPIPKFQMFDVGRSLNLGSWAISWQGSIWSCKGSGHYRRDRPRIGPIPTRIGRIPSWDQLIMFGDRPKIGRAPPWLAGPYHGIGQGSSEHIRDRPDPFGIVGSGRSFCGPIPPKIWDRVRLEDYMSPVLLYVIPHIKYMGSV